MTPAFIFAVLFVGGLLVLLFWKVFYRLYQWVVNLVNKDGPSMSEIMEEKLKDEEEKEKDEW